MDTQTQQVNKPTIGARVTTEFNKVVIRAVKPLGFKNKSALVEAAVREYLERKGFSINQQELVN